MTGTSQQLASAQMGAHSSSTPRRGLMGPNVGAALFGPSFFDHPLSNSDEQQIPPRSQTGIDLLQGGFPRLVGNPGAGAI